MTRPLVLVCVCGLAFARHAAADASRTDDRPFVTAGFLFSSNRGNPRRLTEATKPIGTVSWVRPRNPSSNGAEASSWLSACTLDVARGVSLHRQEVRVVKTALLGAVLLAAATGSVSADPISITATRNIHGDALVDINGLPVVAAHFEEVGTPIGRFSVDRSAHAGSGQISAMAIASQHTTIAGNKWFGFGSTGASATGGIGLDVGESISALEVNFSIAEPTRYSFQGSIGAAGESNSELVLAGGAASSWHHALGLSVEDQLANFRTVQVSHSGVLRPGAYEFFAFAQSSAGLADRTTPGRATFDFDFGFGGSPTPEPASGMLVGVALVAFAYRRSARRRSPT
jgi:hypothetical protein